MTEPIQEVLKLIVSEKLLEILNKDQQKELVSAAVEHFLKGPNGSKYGMPARLNELFEAAVKDVIVGIVKEEVSQNKDLVALIREIFGEASAKVLSGGSRERLVENISEAFRRSISSSFMDNYDD